MGEPSLFDKMISRLRATSKYYTGYPKDLGPSRVIHFTSEREFVQLLHEGHPMVVAFTLRCNLTKHLDGVLAEAAAEFYPHVKFMRVECPKYPGFCITRQRKEYPFIEIFHGPQEAQNEGRVSDANITKYSVKVLPSYLHASSSITILVPTDLERFSSVMGYSRQIHSENLVTNEFELISFCLFVDQIMILCDVKTLAYM
ncbi:unnamed protein product [Malus baccata var. baccata]